MNPATTTRGCEPNRNVANEGLRGGIACRPDLDAAGSGAGGGADEAFRGVRVFPGANDLGWHRKRGSHRRRTDSVSPSNR